MILFGYAGPVIATVAINGIGALIATICVYIYLNRTKFKKNKILLKIFKPLINPIKSIALKKINKRNAKKR